METERSIEILGAIEERRQELISEANEPEALNRGVRRHFLFREFQYAIDDYAQARRFLTDLRSKSTLNFKDATTLLEDIIEVTGRALFQQEKAMEAIGQLLAFRVAIRGVRLGVSEYLVAEESFDLALSDFVGPSLQSFYQRGVSNVLKGSELGVEAAIVDSMRWKNVNRHIFDDYQSKYSELLVEIQEAENIPRALQIEVERELGFMKKMGFPGWKNDFFVGFLALLHLVFLK